MAAILVELQAMQAQLNALCHAPSNGGGTTSKPPPNIVGTGDPPLNTTCVGDPLTREDVQCSLDLR